MKLQKEFRKKIQETLASFDSGDLMYDDSEFWMIQSPYEFIEHYALENELVNTSIALPLARGLHDGVHRKLSVTKDGVSYKLPYVIHCLIVCRILIHMHCDLTKEEEDILYAAALCHDMIEDLDFRDHGRELYTVYHLDPRVYETVKLVSKRDDFTEEEEKEFFHNIESNKLSLLIKLSDRSHNVEDLYNMKVWKVHEYIGETDKFFLPMCAYGKEHFPKLMKPIGVLEDKIRCLTSVSSTMIDSYEAKMEGLRAYLRELRHENQRLRAKYAALWEEEDA